MDRSSMSVPELQRLSRTMREWIVAQSLDSQVGHIGSALCVVDILAVLWGRVLRGAGSDRPGRDYFILSKGHAALALYAALQARGVIDPALMQTYCKDGSRLGVHPEHGAPGIDVGTGSLGQGLSIGCGLAYGLRQRRRAGRVYVLLSDAECNEGQVWEAAMFAAHHGLENLSAVVDLNGLQALGRTRDVLDLAPLSRRWESFGWQARQVDGHDCGALIEAFQPADRRPRAPYVVLAETVLGKGVPFMEDRLEWHYCNLNAELAGTALESLRRCEG